MKRLTVLMVTACCAVGMAACGDDDEDEGGGGSVATVGERTATAPVAVETTPAPTETTPVVTSPPTEKVALSKADLVKQASAICKTADDASDEIDEPANFRTDPEAAATYLGKLDLLAQAQLAGLEALTPPAELEADYAAFLAKEKEATDLLAAVLAKARQRDASGLKDLEAMSRIGDDIDTTAKKAGITGC